VTGRGDGSLEESTDGTVDDVVPAQAVSRGDGRDG
jgi:hypothetical protein